MTEQELQAQWIEQVQKTVGVLYTSNQMLTLKIDDLTAQIQMLEARAQALLDSKRQADQIIAQLQEEISPGRKFNRKFIDPDGTSTNKSD